MVTALASLGLPALALRRSAGRRRARRAPGLRRSPTSSSRSPPRPWRRCSASRRWRSRDIRPVREMGLWTALGLAIAWVVAFTLFPALQKVLRTPTGQTVADPHRPLRPARGRALPAFTFRWRWPLVVGVAGALARPGRGRALRRARAARADAASASTRSTTSTPTCAIHRGHGLLPRARLRAQRGAGLGQDAAPGAATDPEVLRGLDRFTTRGGGACPGVSAAIGPTTFLRLRRYAGRRRATLPEDPEAFAQARRRPRAAAAHRAGAARLHRRGRLSERPAHGDLRARRRRTASRGSQRAPAARPGTGRWPATRPSRRFRCRWSGESLLQAKVGASLVPTLTESFALTAALIFATFLVVFRSARRG